MSFHYLTRYTTPNSDGKAQTVPFTGPEFESLFSRIHDRRSSNLELHDESDQTRALRVELKQEVPFGPPQRVNDRTVFGRYGGAYTGHAYGNSIKGEISADSVNIRPFYYMLYLSGGGKIYVGTQYIGHYGAYEALARTLRDLLGNPASIASHSFRVSAGFYAGAKPREIRIGYARGAEQDHQKSSIGTRRALVFRKGNIDDDFEEQVSKRLLPKLGSSSVEIKKAAADLAADADLISFSDEDVRECSVIAEFRGRTRTFHLLEGGHAASRLPIDVEVDARGHPLEGPCLTAMRDLLKEAVIRRTEDAR